MITFNNFAHFKNLLDMAVQKSWEKSPEEATQEEAKMAYLVSILATHLEDVVSFKMKENGGDVNAAYQVSAEEMRKTSNGNQVINFIESYAEKELV